MKNQIKRKKKIQLLDKNVCICTEILLFPLFLCVLLRDECMYFFATFLSCKLTRSLSLAVLIVHSQIFFSIKNLTKTSSRCLIVCGAGAAAAASKHIHSHSHTYTPTRREKK